MGFAKSQIPQDAETRGGHVLSHQPLEKQKHGAKSSQCTHGTRYMKSEPTPQFV